MLPMPTILLLSSFDIKYVLVEGIVDLSYIVYIKVPVRPRMPHSEGLCL